MDIKASAVYLRSEAQRYPQTSEIHKACLYEYQSECSVSSQRNAKTSTNERDTKKQSHICDCFFVRRQGLEPWTH